MSDKKFRSSKYRLLGLVGQGQFGQVYCAIHRKTGRLMALKNINRDRLPTHRFLRELRFLLSLNHPNIANCYALEQTATGRQLVLDYCEGGTLRDLMEQASALTLAEILTWMTEVLTALEHAQQQGIVHCDIKPENILLTIIPEGWQAKVSDFGIARLSEELKGGRTGATGSPAYMAPERFYFQSSIASDLYAVGVIFYELLVGDRPFSGSYNQLMVAHLNHTVQLPDDLPQAVRSLLFKALEKLAARRFHTATAMKVALLEARQSLTATDLREQYPKPYRDTTCSVFQPRQPLRLPTASEQLAVVSWSPDRQGVLSASEQVVQGWDITNSTVAPITSLSLQWQLPGRVEQILPVCWGAIAITQQTLYHLLPDQPPKPLVKLPVPLQMEIAHQRWCLVQAESATKTTFWLVDVLGKVPTTPRSFVLPPPKGTYQSLLLDQRHILVADCQEQTTYLHILTRWGKFLGTLYLQARVHRLFPSHRPLQVLAQVGAKRQDLLIIRIKPFRVMRCRLDHLFGWVGELVIGYAIASPTGELQMINYHGQAIGNIKGLPIPAEIAFQAPYHLWLTSNETQTPVLHHIDIRDLALDIVF